MSKAPKQVSEFLSKRRIAGAGVSQDVQQPANAIYRKLMVADYHVYAINPNVAQVEGAPCYPDLHSFCTKARESPNQDACINYLLPCVIYFRHNLGTSSF